jgi:hypothetical protein
VGNSINAVSGLDVGLNLNRTDTPDCLARTVQSKGCLGNSGLRNSENGRGLRRSDLLLNFIGYSK